MTAAKTASSFGLVLSGGAACGLANIGVLDALLARGHRPSSIAGSSMGAIVAALYALGHSQETLRDVAAGLAPARVVRLSASPLRGGLHGGVLEQQLERHLEPLVGDARIGDCDIPFVCVAGRVRESIRWERALMPNFTQHVITRVEPVVFPASTRVLDALRATSAIPVVFSPARIDGEEYVDLMHFGAIPVKALRETCAPRTVIATDTMPSYQMLERFMPPAMAEFLSAGYAERDRNLVACEHVVRPELPASMLRFDRSEAFIDAGRAATERCMTVIEEVLTRVG